MKRVGKEKTATLVFIVGMMIFAFSGVASSATWSAGADGNWQTGNWGLGGDWPGQAGREDEDAVIDGGYEVVFDGLSGDVTLPSIALSSTGALVRQSGGVVTVTNGLSGSGTLTLDEGMLVYAGGAFSYSLTRMVVNNGTYINKTGGRSVPQSAGAMLVVNGGQLDFSGKNIDMRNGEFVVNNGAVTNIGNFVMQNGSPRLYIGGGRFEVNNMNGSSPGAMITLTLSGSTIETARVLGPMSVAGVADSGRTITRFEFDEKGITPWTVGGLLNLYDASVSNDYRPALEVDLGGYSSDGNSGSILFNYGSLAGRFGSTSVVHDTLGTLTPGTPGSLASGEYAIRYDEGTVEIYFNSLPPCESAPLFEVNDHVTVNWGSAQFDLTYSILTNAPDHYSIDFDPAAEAEGFVDVPLTSLPPSPITLAVPTAPSTGTYAAVLQVRRIADGCFTNIAFTVAVTSAYPVVSWLGTTSDDIEDPANWSSSPDLPAIDDIVLFDAAANSVINPADGSSVTGATYHFVTKDWTLDDAEIVVGSAIHVEANRTVNLYRYDGTGNVNTEGRDVTFVVDTGGTLNLQGLDTNSNPVAATKNGGGDLFVAGGGGGGGGGGSQNHAVHTWHINGGTLTVKDNVTNAYVLADGAEVRFDDYRNCNPVVSGNGTVRVIGPSKAVSSNARFSHTGDIVIDNSGLRLGNFSSVDWSGHDGSFVMRGSSMIAMAGYLTVNALDGDAASVFRGAYPGGRALTVGTGGGDGSYSGVLQNENGETGHSMRLVKIGTGIQMLHGTNRYTGTTIVSNGTLLVNGSHTGAGAYTVDEGATLGGTGEISAVVHVSGSVAPGDGDIGTLTVTGQVNAAGVWSYELGAAGVCDLLVIEGDFLTNATGALTFDFGGGGEAGTYTLVDWSGATDFTGTEFAATNVADGLSAQFLMNGTQLDVALSNAGSLSAFEQWQTAYFGSTNALNGGVADDFDGDGMSNGDEFRSGTVPTNAASYLGVSAIEVAGGDVIVSWQTSGGDPSGNYGLGITNVLEAATGYDGQFINVLLTNIITTPGDVSTNATVSGAVGGQFFRVRIP